MVFCAISGSATHATPAGQQHRSCPPRDAVILDTTDMTIDAAVGFVLEQYRSRGTVGAKRGTRATGS